MEDSRGMVLSEQSHGTIKIADEVVSIIAGLATIEVPGVAGMSGGFVGGIAEILGKRNLSKGVKVAVGDGKPPLIYILSLNTGSTSPMLPSRPKTMSKLPLKI